MNDPSGVSGHSRAVAVPLAAFLGVFGAHRFYVGRAGSGVLMLFTVGGLGVWWLYDLILVIAGEFRDADGRRVVSWAPADADDPPRRPRPGSPPLDEEIEQLRAELSELAERVDFVERLLARARERGGIPPGAS